MDVQYLFSLTSATSSFLPAIAGITCYRRLVKPVKILTFYYIIVAIISPAQIYMAMHGINNVWLFHFFDPIEYFCLVFAFSYWTGSQKVTRILRYSIPGFIILSLANSLRMPDINHYSYAALAVAYVVYVYISSLAIYNIIKADTGKITADPVFWLAISLFVMSVNNELWYAISDYLPYNRLSRTLLDIHNIFNIFSFFFSTIGIILYKYHGKAEMAPESNVYWNNE